jgi:hypothetical protein
MNSRERRQQFELHDMRATAIMKLYGHSNRVKTLLEVEVLVKGAALEKMMMHAHRVKYLESLRKMGTWEMLIMHGQVSRFDKILNKQTRDVEQCVLLMDVRKTALLTEFCTAQQNKR